MRTGERDLLIGADTGITSQRSIEELGRKPQAREQGKPARIGAAAATAQHFVPALVARVEPPLPVAGRAMTRAGTGGRDTLVLALLEREPLAAAQGADRLGGRDRFDHRCCS